MTQKEALRKTMKMFSGRYVSITRTLDFFSDEKITENECSIFRAKGSSGKTYFGKTFAEAFKKMKEDNREKRTCKKRK